MQLLWRDYNQNALAGKHCFLSSGTCLKTGWNPAQEGFTHVRGGKFQAAPVPTTNPWGPTGSKVCIIVERNSVDRAMCHKAGHPSICLLVQTREVYF